MSNLALNTIFEVFAKIFGGWKSDNVENNNVADMLKTSDDILLFDKTMTEMKKNNQESEVITLSGDRRVRVFLK